MSGEEKRRIKADALLEHEEAKQELGMLRAKAAKWHRALQSISILLDHGARSDQYLKTKAIEARMALGADQAGIGSMVDPTAVLALDAEIEAAVVRVRKAEDAKKQAGFDI